MPRLFALLSAALALALAACSGAASVPPTPTSPSSPTTAAATPAAGAPTPAPADVREFDLPTPDAMPVGVAIDDEGNLWVTNLQSNRLARVRPDDGSVSEWPAPTANAGLYGIAAGGGLVWLGYLTRNGVAAFDPGQQTFRESALPVSDAGPFGLVLKGDALLVSASRASLVLELDARTARERRRWQLPPGSAPGALAVDEAGTAWAALMARNTLARLGTDGSVRELTPPTGSAGLRGLAVAPDGRVWFAEFDANKLGVYDSASDTFREYDLPFPESGPWAVTVASGSGTVWLSEYTGNRLARFDPASQRFQEFALPSPRAGCRALVVDRTGAVWCPESGQSRLLRLQPPE